MAQHRTWAEATQMQYRQVINMSKNYPMGDRTSIQNEHIAGDDVQITSYR